MPMYEYVCRNCGSRITIRIPFAELGTTKPSCANCGSPMERVFTPVGIIYKGAGFYTTDNREGNSDGKD